MSKPRNPGPKRIRAHEKVDLVAKASGRTSKPETRQYEYAATDRTVAWGRGNRLQTSGFGFIVVDLMCRRPSPLIRSLDHRAWD